MSKTTYVAAFLGFILISGMPLYTYADDSPVADSKKAPADAAKKDAPDAAKKKSGDVSGGEFAGDPVYVHLTPVVLPILGDTGPEQLVTIQMTIQVKDFDTADDIHSHMPKVMDALLRSLYGGLSSGSLRDGRVVDIEKVKSRAMTAVQNVEGADNIRDVLIVNVSQRLL